MTMIAQLDTTKTPSPVVALYTYNDSSYMVAPKWMDVTNVKPPIQTGCAYNLTTKVWTYPPAPEDMLAAVKTAVATNNAYLAITNPTAPQNEAQIKALTAQCTRLFNRRIGGR